MLLGAIVVVSPKAGEVVVPPEEISNYRLMDSGPPVQG
jgi:hypothetical protein